MHPPITQLILIQIILVLTSETAVVYPLLNQTAHFDQISEGHLTLQAQQIYVIHKNANTDKAEMLRYSRGEGALLEEESLESGMDFSIYWQISDFETEIMSFPISTAGRADLYTSQQHLTVDEQEEVLFRAVWARSAQYAFFSTLTGTIGYASKTQIASGQLNYLAGSQHFGSTFLSLSPDQKYLCSTDLLSGLVSIWDVGSKTLQRELWLNESGVRSHSWSDNSAFLFLFGYESGTVYRLDSGDRFVCTGTCFTSNILVTYSFYYYETDEIVAISADHSDLILFDWENNHTSLLSTGILQPTKLKPDPASRDFLILNSTDLALFELASLCNSSQFYSKQVNSCVSCTVGCSLCSAARCFACEPNYALSLTRTCVWSPVPDEAPAASQFARELAHSTFAAINKTITIPGHRQFLSTFFELFSNFDHFVLYIYHNRVYGPNMQVILKEIHDTVDYRFQVISNDVCKNDLGIDFGRLQALVDYKLNYSLPNFVALEQNGEGFFEANIEYFFLNIPIILLTLLAYRLAFRLLFDYRLSSLLRRFSFWGILVLLLLEGNVELFFFSFTADFLTYFSVSYQHKLFNLATVLAAFAILLLSTLGLASLYMLYLKKSSFLYENCHGLCSSALYFAFSNGLLNVVRGIIHRAAISKPDMQAVLLLLLQLSEGVFMILWWKKTRIFVSDFVAVLFLLGSFSRVLFNATLLISSLIPLEVLDYMHLAIFVFNVLTFFLSVLQSLLELALRIKHIYTPKVVPLARPKQKTHPSNIFHFRKSEVSKEDESMSKGECQPSKGVQKQWMQTHKGVTVKFCRRKAVTTLSMKPCERRASDKEGRSQVESITLN